MSGRVSPSYLKRGVKACQTVYEKERKLFSYAYDGKNCRQSQTPQRIPDI